MARSALYSTASIPPEVRKVDDNIDRMKRMHWHSVKSDRSALERFVQQVRTAIQSIPAKPSTFASKVKPLKVNNEIIGIPFPGLVNDPNANFTLAYSPPERIDIVGSYAFDCMLKKAEGQTVDLAITMPSEFFNESDYRNLTYFSKRSFYLACIAQGLMLNTRYQLEVNFSLQNDYVLQPTIVVRSSHLHGGSFPCFKGKLRIIVGTSHNKFPMNKSLLSQLYLDPLTVRDSTRSEESMALRLSTIMAESLTLQYHSLLRQSLLDCPSFKDVCVLGSIWLKLRSMDTNISGAGFGSFEWACVTALLLQKRCENSVPFLSPKQNVLQLFRAVLQFLSVGHLEKDHSSAQTKSYAPTSSQRPSIIDQQTHHNILYKMSTLSFKKLQIEARNTLDILEQSTEDFVDACFFLNHAHVVLKYDHVTILKHLSSRSQCLDDEKWIICSALRRILGQGLQDRAVALDVMIPPQRERTVTSCQAYDTEIGPIMVGVMHDAEKCRRLIDRGPAAEAKLESTAFRKLWGPKAELRRFPDGKILETVEWEAQSSASQTSQIIEYLIQRHFSNIFHHGFRTIGDEIFKGLLPPSEGRPASTKVQSSKLEDAIKDLRALSGLPLTIRHIRTTYPRNYYGSSQEGVNIENGAYHSDESADIIIELESSGRWPSAFQAVQRTKMAVLQKMIDMLTKLKPIVRCWIEIGARDAPQLDLASIHIVYENRSEFRVWLYYERDFSYLERDSFYARHTATQNLTLKDLQRLLVFRPAHGQMLQALCTRHPFLASSIDLMKKWRNRHMLSDHVSDELVELLVLRTFLRPHSHVIPASTLAGFVRTLQFISRWDWRSEPLILNTPALMNGDDVDKITTQFETWRGLDPSMNRVVVFAASTQCPDGTTWTESRPNKVSAARLVNLAQAGMHDIESNASNIQVEGLFTPSLQDFDFLIFLTDPNNSPISRENGQHFTNSERPTQEVQSQYDPVAEFVHELRLLYQESVLFYRDMDAGTVIGGLWNPQTQNQVWSLRRRYSSCPSSTPSDINRRSSLNRVATLNDIARHGRELISRIEPRQ